MSGLEPGFQLGHYRILRSLGSGGMADVYEAHDDHLDRTVALKILPVEYSRNPQLVARFQKEVRAAAKLNHRNIVTVFEVGHQDSWHFFSMRLLTGGDLRSRIQRGLSPVEALAILRELADAFAHAHARGFVHRDVKPENVMFDEQGFPVLTDFGIAKALNADTRMTRTGMTMGTPRYLAPEQASGKPVDARADLYSLGIILHEMLTGRPPYDAEESMAVIFKHVTEPIPVMPADFARYQPLLEKLMAKDANQRIASAEDLIREIDAVAPRTPTGEIRQSQLRTAENPLIANLLTPSPLRTPAPKTPRPLPLGNTGLESGEVVVRPPPVTTRPATARPTPPAPTARAPARAPAQEPAAAPARRSVWPAALGGGALAIAVAGAGLVGYRMLQAPTAPATSPAPAAAVPAQPDPKAAAAQEAARQEQLRQDQLRQEQAKRDAAAAEARKAEEQAAAKKLAEQQAAELQARQRAEAAARQKAAADAEAQRQAAAAAEARKKAEAEARKANEADAEARRWAEVEAANKRREEEAAAQAAAKRQTDQDAAAAEAAKKKKEEAAKKTAEKEKSDEQKAKERSRRPTGF